MPQAPDPDRELVQKVIKARDSKAWEVIVRKYLRPVTGFLFRLGWRDGEVDELSDVVQDTFMKAWDSLGRFDETRCRFGTWLFAVAKYVGAGRSRERNRRRVEGEKLTTLSEFVGPQLGQSPDSSPEDEDMEKQALNECLEKLPRPQYQALVLLYRDDLSHREIAEVLGERKVKTVSSRIWRARESLRECLETKGGFS